MPYFHLRLSVPHPPINHVPTLLWPLFGYVVECAHSQPSYLISSSFVSVSSFTRLHSVGAVLSADVRGTSDVDKYCQSKFCSDSSVEQTITEEVPYDSYSSFKEKFSNVSRTEKERRRKIGLANKGNVPWNKGRKHSAETRARIKQRTIEALKDPKVRRKMSESTRAHSDQSRSRIRSSLRRVWGKRLNFPRLREKFYLSWAASIANAAKKGGSDQEELDWDSFDRLKEEIARQKLQRIADKAKAKETAKLRAERAAQAKADKMAKLAQMEKVREEKAKVSGTIKRKTCRKSREEREEFETAQELKLKERLTKESKQVLKQVQRALMKTLLNGLFSWRYNVPESNYRELSQVTTLLHFFFLLFCSTLGLFTVVFKYLCGLQFVATIQIHKKKSINISKQGETANSKIPAWETLDLEFIKREKMQREISLADQIRAAKNRKGAAASLGFYCLEQHKT